MNNDPPPQDPSKAPDRTGAGTGFVLRTVTIDQCRLCKHMDGAWGVLPSSYDHLIKMRKFGKSDMVLTEFCPHIRNLSTIETARFLKDNRFCRACMMSADGQGHDEIKCTFTTRNQEFKCLHNGCTLRYAACEEHYKENEAIANRQKRKLQRNSMNNPNSNSSPSLEDQHIPLRTDQDKDGSLIHGEKGQINNGRPEVATQSPQYYISLSEDCQKIIEELKFQRNQLPRDKFIEKLASNYLDPLAEKLEKACRDTDSYLASTKYQNWYDKAEVEGEWYKLFRAKNDLEEIKTYAMNKDEEDKDQNQVTLKKKAENSKSFVQVKNVQCNLCFHMRSFGMTHKSSIHATRPGIGIGPVTETCPWIVKLPVEKKNFLLDAYEGFCKICLKSHPKAGKPCRFTDLHLGLKCRVDGCQARWILCVEHHDKNKSKLKEFKDLCEEAGIEANVELTH